MQHSGDATDDPASVNYAPPHKIGENMAFAPIYVVYGTLIVMIAFIAAAWHEARAVLRQIVCVERTERMDRACLGDSLYGAAPSRWRRRADSVHKESAHNKDAPKRRAKFQAHALSI